MAPSAGTGPSTAPLLHPPDPAAPQSCTARTPNSCGTAQDAQRGHPLPWDSTTAAGLILEKTPCHWETARERCSKRVFS